MSLVGLLDSLRPVEGYRRLLDALSRGAAPGATVIDAAKPYVIAALWRDLGRPMVLVCPHPDDARRMVEQLQAYCGDDAPVLHFAESEILPYERLSIEAGTVHERLSALGALHAYASSPHSAPTPTLSQEMGAGAIKAAPPLIVTSITGLMQKTLGPELFVEQSHVIQAGQKLAVEPLLQQWARMGYHMSAVVEEPGSAARRGGIIDVYGLGQPQPARIDLWGDVVDTLRAFETGSQRSTERLDTLRVVPAGEMLPALADADAVDRMVRALDFSNCQTSERDRLHEDMAELMSGMSLDSASLFAGFLLRHTLLDHIAYLSGAGVDVAVLVDEPGEADESGRHQEEAAEKLRLAKEGRGELPLGFPSGMAPWPVISRFLGAWQSRLSISRFHQAQGQATEQDDGQDRGDQGDGSNEHVSLSFAAPPGYSGGLDRLNEALRRRSSPVVIATQHSRRLEEVLHEDGIGARETRSLDTLDTDVVDIVHTTLPGGWVLHASEEDDKPSLTLLTDAEVFGTVKRRLTRPRRHAQRLRAVSAEELQPGQYVVHVDHGIGRFTGTISRPGTGLRQAQGEQTEDGSDAAREYLVLEYAEGDKLYVPMEHLDRLSPYIGGDEASPSPTRLGTQEWSKAVSRAKESTKKLAVDLLALYAQREMAEGFPHAADSPWQREMEDAFPYVETPDQQAAIDEMKVDLEAPKPMDRLVCGDVGYGKTEVALRAAFKAVQSGKQVAVLVPTTVLAQQHYNTFTERLSPYPVKVEVLSRFRLPKEQDEVVARLKRGDIDIVVGTHRLVQKDVGFKDIGLIIIDEEHRFGVGHKERLKELRREVDVLTLTATPIPRTLHMALAGIRDISTIETPPEERLPIRTYLAEASDDLIREAILRELDRGGQVYFLHNRVKTIDLAAEKIRELVPEARVVVGHGQMPEDMLSGAMEAFADGEADVLVCTTIIESGLDIPAVNTMIVDRADRLGLAQLYQLRGRIGRRSQRAYAYLLVERGRRLTDMAHRRLQTIVAATELGAGFRIAMKDLEIRGAGNLLGAEQSGQIHAVGFDLYTRLLAQAVAELRAATGTGPPVTEDLPDPVLDLGLPASIPEDLVPHMPSRMAMYQRIAKARTLDEVDELPQEFYDRFGHQLPDELHWLLYAARLRILGRQARVESVTRREDRVTLKLLDQVGGARAPLQHALGHGVVVGNQQVHMPTNRNDMPWGQALLEVLERLEGFQTRVAEMVSSA
ncbi:MAG: transcription-repair coupling factor [Dehalococcoidia bacterium]